MGNPAGGSGANPAGRGGGARGGTAGTATAVGGGAGALGRGGASGNAPSAGGTAGGAASGGRAASGGNAGRSSAAGSSGAAGSAGETSESPCDGAGLAWRSANKTNYTSYPDPGSEECIKYNGCMWAGQFAACDEKETEAWVSSHDIVAAFPDFDALALHDLCLRKGNQTIVVTVLDTCGDDDCDGCCTENKGSADELIDVESYTNARWGVEDGPIEWADLGPTRGAGCD